jgi:hypothetical protein
MSIILINIRNCSVYVNVRNHSRRLMSGPEASLNHRQIIRHTYVNARTYGKPVITSTYNTHKVAPEATTHLSRRQKHGTPKSKQDLRHTYVNTRT